MMPTMQQQIRHVLHTSIQNTTYEFAGISLTENSGPLSDDICTIHTTWEGSHKAVLLMRADRALLTRLTKRILRSDTVAPQDVEDVATEFFNIVCGQVASGLYRISHISTRFQVPRFHPGSYLPKDDIACRCVLNYTNLDRESVQLAFLGLSPADRPQ